MTTQNQKWTTTAGPRQTKPVNQALNRLLEEHRHYVELTGTVGIPESEDRHDYFSFFIGQNREDVVTAWQTIGEKYNWTITAENRGQIIADVNAALTDLIKNRPVNDKRITAAVVAEREQAKKANEEQERQAKNRLRRRLCQDPHRKPWADFSTTKSNHARAAANLKRELELAFPGTKFSVKSESYSGGDAVSVNWDFGPTVEQVSTISGQYAEGHFDGMTDSYVTDRSPEGRAHNKMLGGVSYVNENRSYSSNSDTYEKLGRMLCELQHVTFQGPDTKNLQGENDRDLLSDHIRQLLARTSFPAGAEIKGVEYAADTDDHWCKIRLSSPAHPIRSAPGNVSIATLSENQEKGGLEIRFPAKPNQSVIDSLKTHGWRWSRFSSCWWAKDTPNARAFAATIVKAPLPESEPVAHPPAPPMRAGIRRFNPTSAIAAAVTVNATTSAAQEPTAPPPQTPNVVPVQFAPSASAQPVTVTPEPATVPLAMPAIPAWKQRLRV